MEIFMICKVLVDPLKVRFSPLILNLGVRWGIGVLLHAADSLTLRKESQCPLHMKLGGSEDMSGRFGKEINFLPILGIEPRFLGCPSRCLVTKLTELSGLFIVCTLHQIFIIIILHELGLTRPVAALCNILFKGLPSRLRPLFYNSALFLESCCSFLLHVVDSLICIFLVSRQLILLSALPKFLHSFCGQKGCIRLSF